MAVETAMLKILFTSAALALGLSGCSQKDDGMDRAKNSAGAVESSKAMASNTADALTPASPDMARATQDSAHNTKGAVAKKDREPQRNTTNAIDRYNTNRASADKKWIDFHGMLKKCYAMSSPEKAQCLADAGDTYQALKFDCRALSNSDKKQCLKYDDELKSATASLSTPAVTHTTEPTMTSTNPGDSSAAERNRDSTKQQQEAAGAVTEQKSKN
jgi:hypothetical protein